jgi:hypothetical protein
MPRRWHYRRRRTWSSCDWVLESPGQVDARRSLSPGETLIGVSSHGQTDEPGEVGDQWARRDLNPHSRCREADFKSAASASSATGPLVASVRTPRLRVGIGGSAIESVDDITVGGDHASPRRSGGRAAEGTALLKRRVSKGAPRVRIPPRPLADAFCDTSPAPAGLCAFWPRLLLSG